MNLQGFSTEQQNFAGLHRVADNIRQDGYRAEERDYRRGLQQEQQKIRTGAFLEGFANPKDHLSGSPYDPEIVKGFNDMLQKGLQLAQGGADQNTILMALGPEAGKLTEYAQKAKLLSEQRKKSLELVKGIKGVDPQKFIQAFDDAAFYERDPQTGERRMRDISQIDPNRLYADEVLRTGEVYTNEGLQNWVKSAKQEKVVRDYTYYDKSGRMHRTKGEYSAPGFMVSDEDASGAHLGFVPDYEVVTDEGRPVEHEFVGADGTPAKAPVRMVKESVFNALPPEGKAYLLQEARRYAKEKGLPASAKQVEVLARTLAYDEIRDSGKYGSTVSELTQTKPSQYEVKNYYNIPLYKQGGSGSSSDSTSFNDLFTGIDQAATDLRDAYAGGDARTNRLSLSSLSTEQQEAVLQKARNLAANNNLLPEDVVLIKGTDGKLGMYHTGDGTRIGYLTQTGVNLKAQADVKGKREVINRGNAGGQSPQPAPAPAKRKPLSAFTKQ